MDATDGGTEAGAAGGVSACRTYSFSCFLKYRFVTFATPSAGRSCASSRGGNTPGKALGSKITGKQDGPAPPVSWSWCFPSWRCSCIELTGKRKFVGATGRSSALLAKARVQTPHFSGPALAPSRASSLPQVLRSRDHPPCGACSIHISRESELAREEVSAAPKTRAFGRLPSRASSLPQVLHSSSPARHSTQLLDITANLPDDLRRFTTPIRSTPP